jgi:hypothetical protein
VSSAVTVKGAELPAKRGVKKPATAKVDAGAVTMIILSVAEPVPHAFVALMVTLVVPAAVGVPVIAPVLVFTDSPEGKGAAL